MNSEPLKRKLYTPSNIEYQGISLDKPFLFRLDDLKSAVEWLKHELWSGIKLKDCIELIDEAFEDVIKK